MVERGDLITSFGQLGNELRLAIQESQSDADHELNQVKQRAFVQNGWFTSNEVDHALQQWADLLHEDKITNWLSTYSSPKTPLNVGLVLAGNIPLVGFHDVLCTILAGHKAHIKCSSTDSILLTYLLEKLVAIEPQIKEHFTIQDGFLKSWDAAIATGSSNSARYFNQYFGSKPSIIRKNRTSIAVLDGSESEEELAGLMEDAFRYFGLGCRNVTKLFVPINYDLNKIFKASIPFSYLLENKKYVNNYNYHKTLMMMNQETILENDLFVLAEKTDIFSPVSVLNYETYKTEEELTNKIEPILDDIQCVIGNKNLAFGEAQKPGLDDYADGIDTMDFLVNLRCE